MAKKRVLVEFWQFLREEKKYWLMPIVIVFGPSSSSSSCSAC
jgi:hypothetical protein